jgi:predicted MFS family arabinose efflux permease
VAFGFMGGGGVGTAIGGRVITSVGYAHFYGFYGLLLLALLVLARMVVSELKP